MKKTNWKALVHAQQAREFVLPEGFESLEDIATSMGCSEDKARTNLAPAVKQKLVEMKRCPIFDKETKTVRYVTAYRELPAKKK